MNNTLPLVSVVMSVFNGEVYLASAIESILKQTYDNFEFIILNNASTDRTKDIILSYKDPRLLFVDSTTNLGFTKSLNKMLAFEIYGVFCLVMDLVQKEILD